ncbi:MAG TPA: hypothetical protein ENO00_04985 [Deltaproteobacteria bacterium]|nr:hypothetical protein [Deltaproteobacteria bacterium]
MCHTLRIETILKKQYVKKVSREIQSQCEIEDEIFGRIALGSVGADKVKVAASITEADQFLN